MWIFKGRGGLGQIYTLFKIFLFKKNFVLFHPVFGVGGRIFGLIDMTFSLFLLSNVLSIPPSKVRIPLTSLKNFKFFWVGRSFSGENWRQFFPPKMCFHTLGGGGSGRHLSIDRKILLPGSVGPSFSMEAGKTCREPQ